jgi:hypothetical protein
MGLADLLDHRGPSSAVRTQDDDFKRAVWVTASGEAVANHASHKDPDPSTALGMTNFKG